MIFNPKADNQRKTISCMRQCITLGGWSKGGPGEPIGMVNKAMTLYRDMRKDPATSKRLVDPANYLITIARRMNPRGKNTRDTVLDEQELRELAFKNVPDQATVEDVLDAMRKVATKLSQGKHPAGACNTPNVDMIIKAASAELKAIADAKRNVVNQAAADAITQAADQQAKAGAPV